MLATRISFMNELAALCAATGANIENVRLGIGSDPRIGYSYMYAGCGYGGPCLPKDVKALIRQARQHRLEPRILEAVDRINEEQKHLIFRITEQRFGRDLTGKLFAVWGLSFKPNTDDVREAPALLLIRQLIEAGARVRAFDPAAIENARALLPRRWLTSGQIELVREQYAVLRAADALILVTEWKSFRSPDLERIKKLMRGRVLIDGRNQYDRKAVTAVGFEYYGIGR
jgi:UDPglucose 6-dehydrogenase